jgi:hypothetical protein
MINIILCIKERERALDIEIAAGELSIVVGLLCVGLGKIKNDTFGSARARFAIENFFTSRAPRDAPVPRNFDRTDHLWRGCRRRSDCSPRRLIKAVVWSRMKRR